MEQSVLCKLCISYTHASLRIYNPVVQNGDKLLNSYYMKKFRLAEDIRNEDK